MEWISVKDRLPEEGVLVLTFSKKSLKGKNSYFCLEYMIKFEDDSSEPYIWSHRLVDEWSELSHWMPLPGKPEK